MRRERCDRGEAYVAMTSNEQPRGEVGFVCLHVCNPHQQATKPSQSAHALHCRQAGEQAGHRAHL